MTLFNEYLAFFFDFQELIVMLVLQIRINLLIMKNIKRLTLLVALVAMAIKVFL